MDKKSKQRAFAVFIGIIMLTSTAGFALFSSVNRLGGSPQQQNTVQVPAVVGRPLSGEEVLAVLQSGKALMQYQYPKDCTSCMSEKALLESFTLKYSGSLVLEETDGNRSLELTTASGQILNITNATVSEDGLLKFLCVSTAIQPKDCVFVDY